MHTLPASVRDVAARTPLAPAMVDGEQRITYAGFWQASNAFAAWLRDDGLQRGDRVALILPNSIGTAVALYGIWLAGGIAVPLNAQARARDLAPWLTHAGATRVIHVEGHADALAAMDASDANIRRIGLQLLRDLTTLPRNVDDDVHAGDVPELSDAALIVYTSGTTGAPKGVTLSHANLASNAAAVVSYLGLGTGDSVLSILPFYYVYGASVLHTHLVSGACVHLAENLLFPHLIVEYLQQQDITGFSGVPSTFALLLDRVALADYPLPRLRYLTQAGGAMGSTLTGRLRTALPRQALFVMYGQTEATSRLTWLPPERLDDKAGSVGIPIDGVRLRIVREDGTPADPGETGQVHAQGPGTMLGYWRDPEATARTLHDGWLATGDIGHLDDDGFLFLEGRRSDMIKTGAHRVYPGDIEEAIAELQGVSGVAVVGVDDDTLGQVVKAYVVADPVQPPSVDAIKRHCRARLAAYKIPRQIEFIATLPLTASGKIRRAALTQRTETT